jgi:pyridoxamine 5'-phosphate oxidase
MTTIADLRREYASRALIESDAHDDPMRQFGLWFEEALETQLLDVNAMTLATATPSGEPSARTVLLKGFDERGFVFFTNYESAKGAQLAANPRACLLFFWAELERQVRISGDVEQTSREESEQYFLSRPLESQIGAWASAQSRPVSNRAELEERYATLLSNYAEGNIPVPHYWGGYRVRPDAIEFWQGRKSRLHDRLLYTKRDGAWSRVRLAP